MLKEISAGFEPVLCNSQSAFCSSWVKALQNHVKWPDGWMDGFLMIANTSSLSLLGVPCVPQEQQRMDRV